MGAEEAFSLDEVIGTCGISDLTSLPILLNSTNTGRIDKLI